MNFSVFESVPDVWAIDQVFPIVPIARLDRAPERRGVIADLTCDSDGRIDQYVDADGVDVSLPLHALRDGEPYRLGIFMVGAYQETLGDIHNLFGDTDAVNVRLTDDGYEFAHVAPRRHHRRDARLRRLRPRRAARGVSRQDCRGRRGGEARRAGSKRRWRQGLTGYTYLAETV